MPDPFTLTLLAVAAGGGWVAVGNGSDDSSGSADTDQGSTTDDTSTAPTENVALTYSTEFWRATVARLCGSQPVEFHMAWIQVESAGNAAAVGSIRAMGPDGYALEMGLYQLYNPDELRLAGVTSAQLRPSYAMAKTGSQSMLAALTSDDADVQVQAGVNYIAKRRAQADQLLASVGASWNETDTWRLVKCYHALSGLPRAAMVGYNATNGGPPADWAAFRAFAASADLTPWGGKNLAAYAPYIKVLANAEKVGGAVAA